MIKIDEKRKEAQILLSYFFIPNNSSESKAQKGKSRRDFDGEGSKFNISFIHSFKWYPV